MFISSNIYSPESHKVLFEWLQYILELSPKNVFAVVWKSTCERLCQVKIVECGEEMPLRHVGMVTKVLDLNKLWSCNFARKTRKVHDCAREQNNTPYFTTIIRQCKWPSLSRQIVEIQKFCQPRRQGLISSSRPWEWGWNFATIVRTTMAATSFPGSSLYLEKVERGPWERGCHGCYHG